MLLGVCEEKNLPTHLFNYLPYYQVEDIFLILRQRETSIWKASNESAKRSARDLGPAWLHWLPTDFDGLLHKHEHRMKREAPAVFWQSYLTVGSSEKLLFWAPSIITYS